MSLEALILEAQAGYQSHQTCFGLTPGSPDKMNDSDSASDKPRPFPTQWRPLDSTSRPGTHEMIGAMLNFC